MTALLWAAVDSEIRRVLPSHLAAIILLAIRHRFSELSGESA